MPLPASLDIAFGTGDTVTVQKVNQDANGTTYFAKSDASESTVYVRHTSSTKKDGITYDRHNMEIVRRIYSSTAGVPDTIVRSSVVLESPKRATLAVSTSPGTAMRNAFTAQMVADLIQWLT